MAKPEFLNTFFKVPEKDPSKGKGFVPPGLQKKPGGMSPGQYKKQVGAENNGYEHIYQATTLYLDPEAQIRASGISQSYVIPKSQKDIVLETDRYNALYAKGFHPAKVPHPIFTHYQRGKK